MTHLYIPLTAPIGSAIQAIKREARNAEILSVKVRKRYITISYQKESNR